MRVAVRHTDKKHPNHGWFAFELGRIVGGRDPISGTAYSAEEVADALLRRSKEQYPEAEGYEHRIETLHVADHDEHGNEIGAWHPIGKSKLPRSGTPAPTAEHDLTVSQGQRSDT